MHAQKHYKIIGVYAQRINNNNKFSENSVYRKWYDSNFNFAKKDKIYTNKFNNNFSKILKALKFIRRPSYTMPTSRTDIEKSQNISNNFKQNKLTVVAFETRKPKQNTTKTKYYKNY